jgi:2-polyprenyl-6-methoxyphenol hydroxylase-like FAD-dependent oxidoreductase
MTDVKHVQIIIVGAGPTGLMLANQLSRWGADFLVLDKKSGPTLESRALIVQARSMEIYEEMGLSEEIEKEGKPAGGISFYKKGRRLLSLSLRNMGEKLSPFPYVMIYEQSNNEKILNAHLESLGERVLWNTTITDIEEKEGRYFIGTGPDGADGYTCSYLIACDGSKSMVRDFAGVAFSGGAYENVFYVADTHIRGADLAEDKMSLFFTRESISMLFPMQGKERFRLLGILPKEYYHRNDIRFDDIVTHVRENLQLPVEFYETQWYSTYKLYYKKVDHFRKNNVFFAGDAAHVHSPAGGQGMNTGLQDAYNLGWKLALVTRGLSAAGLLDTYHEERNPIAERLLRTTDRVFTIMTGSNRLFGFFKLYVVPRILPLFNRFKKLRTVWFGEVSQTRIGYPASSLSLGTAGKLKAGQRFPWFSIQKDGRQVSVYQLLKEAHVAPFLILMYNLPDQDWMKLDDRQFSVLSLESGKENAAILKEMGFPGSFVVLLRPDNYIGYISESGDRTAFERLMKDNYFLKGPLSKV